MGVYGYYADVANECQIFHICYPVTYADGIEEMLKWSFICPAGTIFDQSTLVCSFPLDALHCEEAPNFFDGPDSINPDLDKLKNPTPTTKIIVKIHQRENLSFVCKCHGKNVSQSCVLLSKYFVVCYKKFSKVN